MTVVIRVTIKDTLIGGGVLTSAFISRSWSVISSAEHLRLMSCHPATVIPTLMANPNGVPTYLVLNLTSSPHSSFNPLLLGQVYQKGLVNPASYTVRRGGIQVNFDMLKQLNTDFNI